MVLAGPASGLVPDWSPLSPHSAPTVATATAPSSLPDDDDKSLPEPHTTSCFAPTVRDMTLEAGRLEAEIDAFETLLSVTGYTVYFDGDSPDGQAARVFAQHTFV